MEPIRCTFWELTDKPKVVIYRDENGEPAAWGPIYRNPETGEESPSRDLPLGAMLDHSHLGPYYKARAGEDGRYLVCKVPGKGGGHFWHIDGRASNCTRPDDDEHRCWVREGEVPNVTAGKQGNTCDAGAGSIQTDSWHGFLRDGYLVDA